MDGSPLFSGLDFFSAEDMMLHGSEFLDAATLAAICGAANQAGSPAGRAAPQSSGAGSKRLPCAAAPAAEEDSDEDDEGAKGPASKKSKGEASQAAKVKACKEKARREKMNDRFSELAKLIEPGQEPKTDKPSILADAIKYVQQMVMENHQLKMLNKFLEERVSHYERERGQALYQQSLAVQQQQQQQQPMGGMLPGAGGMVGGIGAQPMQVPGMHGIASTSCASTSGAYMPMQPQMQPQLLPQMQPQMQPQLQPQLQPQVQPQMMQQASTSYPMMQQPMTGAQQMCHPHAMQQLPMQATQPMQAGMFHSPAVQGQLQMQQQGMMPPGTQQQQQQQQPMYNQQQQAGQQQQQQAETQQDQALMQQPKQELQHAAQEQQLGTSAPCETDQQQQQQQQQQQGAGQQAVQAGPQSTYRLGMKPAMAGLQGLMAGAQPTAGHAVQQQQWMSPGMLDMAQDSLLRPPVA